MRPPVFSVTPMRSSGSRVDWKIFFVISTKLIPRKIFFVYCKHFGVDGNSQELRVVTVITAKHEFSGIPRSAVR